MIECGLGAGGGVRNIRVFIAGVMQASNTDKALVSQIYRNDIAGQLLRRWPDLEVIDPLQLHPASVGYDDAVARETLFAMAGLAAESDLVIAYLPVASMGTALEMYFADRAGVPVLTISPMRENWVVRVLSTRVFPDNGAFLEWLDEVEVLPCR